MAVSFSEPFKINPNNGEVLAQTPTMPADIYWVGAHAAGTGRGTYLVVQLSGETVVFSTPLIHATEGQASFPTLFQFELQAGDRIVLVVATDGAPLVGRFKGSL